MANQTTGKQSSTQKTTKAKPVKRKKTHWVRRVILSLLAIIIIAGGIYAVPKLITVVKLYREAQSYVAKSSTGTFQDSKTTVLYDAAGQVLHTMKQSKDLYYVESEEIPATLKDAFVVMEDRQFYEHSGFDLRAIIRAIVVNQQRNDIAQGASTITQQLARNIFLTQEVSWQRKVEEIFIAVGLEKKFSKNQILEFYLNNIYFGNGYYGVEAASRGYFSKSVSELTLAEQAFIAAIPNSPTRYNPLTHYDNTVQRKNLILEQMYQEGKLSSLDAYMAKDEQVVLNEAKSTEVNQSAITYARHCATESLMSAYGFTFRYNFDTQQDYDMYASSYETYYTMCQQKLLSGGYTVYTSLELDKQQALQDAIDTSLAGYRALSDEGVYTMQGAATCIDNNTGNVVAIVGSRSQAEIKGYGLNRAYQSDRQPGSSIKPLIAYLPYIQMGNTPDTIVTDEAIEGGPANADGIFSGDITFREAVRTSKNTIAWKILTQITPRSGVSFLTSMGFANVWQDKDHIASALGGFTYGVTTEEMAGAYATIINDGMYRKATCIVKILDASNRPIVDTSNRAVKVYDANAAKMMTDMLRTVVTQGTGVTASPDNAIVAGKTGTTNSTKDAWFCGYSRYYTTAVWTGYDYPKEIENPMANDIFKNYMTQIHQGLALVDFTAANAPAIQPATTEAATENTTLETQSSQESSTAQEMTTAVMPNQTTAVQNNQDRNNNQNNHQQTTKATQQTTTARQTQPERTTHSPLDQDAPTRGDMDAVTQGGDW